MSKSLSLTSPKIPIIGLDIGPDSIRITEIEKNSDGYHLNNLGILETPPGCVENGFIVKPTIVGQAIKSLLKNRKFSTKNVITAVRGPNIISRLITLPSVPIDKLEHLIASEVKRYVLFGDRDKIVYYHPVEEFEEDGRTKISLLLVVADKELCNTYYSALKVAGIEPKSIDFSFFSILRLLHTSYTKPSEETIMAIIVDFNGGCITIFSGEKLRFLRNVQIPEDVFIGEDSEVIDELVSQILLAAHFYEVEFPRGGNIDKIILCLGAAWGAQLYQKLTNSITSTPIEIYAPFSNIKVKKHSFPPEIIEQIDFGFSTVVGLSLRDQETESMPFQVDLLPQEITEKKKLVKEFKLFLLVILLLVAGVSFYITNLSATYRKLENQMRDMNLRTQEVDLQLKNIERKKNERFEAIGSTPEVVQSTRLLPNSKLLEQIKTFIPVDVQLVSIEFKEPSLIRFEGFADTKESVFVFFKSLAQTPNFSNVQLSSMDSKQIKSNEEIKFIITANYSF